MVSSDDADPDNPDPLADILTLAEAAERLGIAASTLRHQATAGRLRARLIGKTWLTTAVEVERYRDGHLGKFGRPRNLPVTPAELELLRAALAGEGT